MAKRAGFLFLFLMGVALFLSPYRLIYIPSNSMWPLLQEGDLILIRKFAKSESPPRGAIVTFHKDHKRMVKRIAALPSDHLRFDQRGIHGQNREGKPFFLKGPYLPIVSFEKTITSPSLTLFTAPIEPRDDIDPSFQLTIDHLIRGRLIEIQNPPKPPPRGTLIALLLEYHPYLQREEDEPLTFKTNIILLPLMKKEIDRLRSLLSISPFRVKESSAMRKTFLCHLPAVADEYYYFLDGKAYTLSSTTPLASDHPLYHLSLSQMVALFNESNPYFYLDEGTIFYRGEPWFDLPTIAEQKIGNKANPGNETRWIPISPPEEQFLLLGELSNLSYDSRHFGFVKREALEAIVLWRIRGWTAMSLPRGTDDE